MTIRILLADDHQIVREGLGSLLRSKPDMEVVAEVEDGHTAVELARKLAPDVVVMDIGMPTLNGIEATRQIKREVPQAKVVALSVHADKRFVAGMFQAGASAYLLKKGAFDELAQAIRAVAAGQVYLSPRVAGGVIEDYMQRLEAPSPPSVLTSREREILQLFAEGKTTQQIAALLHLSVNTVGTHRSHIMKKLGVRTVSQLIRYALREGLIFLDA